MPNLELYRDLSLRLALDRVDERIPNRSLDHAKILTEVMLTNTRSDEHIYIYSGDLPEDVYAPWLQTSRAETISILVDDDSQLGWLDPIREKRGNSLTVQTIGHARPNHFLCTTGGFFRYETDPNTFTAEANFNEPAVVQRLIKAHQGYAQTS